MIMSLYLQPPREYMEEVIGLVSSLEGMVLRREAQLSVAGIQVPFSFPGIYHTSDDMLISTVLIDYLCRAHLTHTTCILYLHAPTS